MDIEEKQVAETWETVEIGIPFTPEKINAEVYKKYYDYIQKNNEIEDYAPVEEEELDM